MIIESKALNCPGQISKCFIIFSIDCLATRQHNDDDDHGDNNLFPVFLVSDQLLASQLTLRSYIAHKPTANYAILKVYLCTSKLKIMNESILISEGSD